MLSGINVCMTGCPNTSRTQQHLQAMVSLKTFADTRTDCNFTIFPWPLRKERLVMEFVLFHTVGLCYKPAGLLFIQN